MLPSKRQRVQASGFTSRLLALLFGSRSLFRGKRKGSAQKGFCKNLFYSQRGRRGRGTFVEPKAIRGQFVE